MHRPRYGGQMLPACRLWRGAAKQHERMVDTAQQIVEPDSRAIGRLQRSGVRCPIPRPWPSCEPYVPKPLMMILAHNRAGVIGNAQLRILNRDLVLHCI